MSDVYNKFKYILSGCDNIMDAFIFANIFVKEYPEHKKLLKSMVISKKYDLYTDMKTTISTLEKYDEYQYRNDIEKEIDNMDKNLYSDIQLKVFERLSNLKPSLNKKCENTRKVIVLENNTVLDNLIGKNIEDLCIDSDYNISDSK